MLILEVVWFALNGKTTTGGQLLQEKNILALQEFFHKILLLVFKRVFNLFVQREAERCLCNSFNYWWRSTFVKSPQTLSFDDVFCHVHDFCWHVWAVIGLKSVDLQINLH